MTVPFWVSIIVAVIAGVFAGVVSPLVTAKLAKRNWRAQKTFDLKYDIFRGAVKALALWTTDALDTQLQSSKVAYKGRTREVEMRAETSQALEQYRGLVEAFFSKEVALKFGEATRAPISIDTVPNTKFEEKRLAFVEAASRELGLSGS
jgi:hypothetical protein